MANRCKICGAEIDGKRKFCQKCQRQKEREYQRRRYENDETFRQKKIQSAKKSQQKRSNLGSLSRYSHHRKKDFDKEYQVVQSMKKQAFKGKPNGKHTQQNNENNYNVEAYQRYNEAIGYENQKLDTFKRCPICGGTEFIRERGMIVCTICGLCEEVFCMSAYGFDEWGAEDLDNDFLRALRKLGDKDGK